jgi:hypothetical protein
MSSTKNKIVLKKLKDTDKVWHSDSTLVFKSLKDKVVIGRYFEKEIIPLDDLCLELCSKWKFKYDKDLVEEDEEEEEEEEEVVENNEDGEEEQQKETEQEKLNEIEKEESQVEKEESEGEKEESEEDDKNDEEAVDNIKGNTELIDLGAPTIT